MSKGRLSWALTMGEVSVKSNSRPFTRSTCPHPLDPLPLALLVGVTALGLSALSLGQSSGVGPPLTLDQFGVLQSSSTNDFNTGSTNGFFANLGTNGRTCGTCHVEGNAWTFTPLHARLLAKNDPLFAPVDGADCPPVSSSQEPNRANSSMVLNYALIRIQLAIPAGANFTLTSATNPKECAIAPGSQAIAGNLFLFRRPLPSTNLMLLSSVMWDGRETLEKITTQAGEQSTSLLFDLDDQANTATTDHAQGASIAGTQAQQDIVTFETGLSTAQVILVPDPPVRHRTAESAGSRWWCRLSAEHADAGLRHRGQQSLEPTVHQHNLHALLGVGAEQS